MRPTRVLYNETYNGVLIEVSKHYVGDAEVWCYYLLLCAEQFDSKYRGELMPPVFCTDYGTIIQPPPELLMSLDWHSGITFYEITKSTKSPYTLIKAGCDFSHLWDEGMKYNEEDIMKEAKRCVDSLHLKFPTFKSMDELWVEYRRPFKEAMDLKNAP